MSHADVTGKALQVFLVKDLVHQTHILFTQHSSLRSLGIGHGNTCRLLPAMLQGDQAVIDVLRNVFSR